MNRRYHEVFIPGIDVYKEGGRDSLTQLECSRDGDKNLVVLTKNLLDQLGSLAAGGDLGAREVLDSLDTAFENRGKGSVRELHQGLDVALILNEKIDGLEKPSSLEGHITRNKWAGDNKPVFMTADRALRVRLKAQGHRVESPRFLEVSADIVGEGIISVENMDLQARLNTRGETVPLIQAEDTLGRSLYPNQFVKFAGSGEVQYARVIGQLVREGFRVVGFENPELRMLRPEEGGKRLHIGEDGMDSVLDIFPKDMEQYLALQYGLLNRDVELMFICGSQGSGKTILTYAAAIDAVLWHDQGVREKRGLKKEVKGGLFNQVVLLKPIDIVGGARREVGFLPGTLFEKLAPHLGPYIDAHNQSCLGGLLPFEELFKHPKYETSNFGKRDPSSEKIKINDSAHLPSDRPVIELAYSGFVRGRSFTNSLIVIDEAHNYTPYELKTIIERAGEGCKIVVLGDPQQLDNPNCTRERNGLTHAIKQFLGKPYVGLIRLTHNYRSQASRDALNWRVPAT